MGSIGIPGSGVSRTAGRRDPKFPVLEILANKKAGGLRLRFLVSRSHNKQLLSKQISDLTLQKEGRKVKREGGGLQLVTLVWGVLEEQ